MLKIAALAFCFGVLSLCTQPASAGQPDVETASQPGSMQGVLTNGIRYLILRGDGTSRQNAVRLVVEVGAANEEQHQPQISHLLEHIAFDGTRTFPGEKFLDHYAELGLSKAAMTAQTNVNSTIYGVTAEARLGLDPLLSLLRDFATDAEISEASLERQKGVVVAEIVYRKSVDYSNQRKALRDLAFGQESSADGYFVETRRALAQISVGDVRSFYEKWYTSDRMLVVVVTDEDLIAAKRSVAEIFGSIKTRVAAAPHAQPTTASAGALKFSVRSGAKEAELSLVSSYRLDDRVGTDIRATALTVLLRNLLEARIESIRRSDAAQVPGLHAGVDVSDLGRGGQRVTLFTTSFSDPHAAPDIFSNMADLIDQLRKFGFSEAEVAAAKQQAIKDFVPERSSNASLANIVRGNFVLYGVFEDPDDFHQRVASCLREIDAGETNAFVKKAIAPVHEQNVLLSGNWGAGFEEAAAAAFRERMNAAVNPIPYTAPSGSLVLEGFSPPRPGWIAAVDKTDTGLSRLRLSNGAQVIIIPVSGDSTEIRAFRGGGLSAYGGGDRAAAAALAGAVGRFELQGRPGLKIRDTATDLGISIRLAIDELGATVQLQGAGELEPKLQLLQLLMVADDRHQIARFTVDSGKAFNQSDSFDEISPRFEPIQGRPAPLRFASAFDIYRDRFTKAGDYVFLVAAADNQSNRDLIARYIGSLDPARSAVGSDSRTAPRFVTRHYRDIYGDAPEGVAYKGAFIAGQKRLDNVGRLELGLAGKILEMSMMELLRQKEGAVYAPDAGVRIYSVPAKNKLPDSYALYAIFSSLDDDLDRLDQVMVDALLRLKRGEVEETVFAEARSQYLASMRTFASNPETINSVYDRVSLGRSVKPDERDLLAIESIKTAKDFAPIVRRLLAGNVSEVTRLPASRAGQDHEE